MIRIALARDFIIMSQWIKLKMEIIFLFLKPYFFPASLWHNTYFIILMGNITLIRVELLTIYLLRKFESQPVSMNPYWSLRVGLIHAQKQIHKLS